MNFRLLIEMWMKQFPDGEFRSWLTRRMPLEWHEIRQEGFTMWHTAKPEVEG